MSRAIEVEPASRLGVRGWLDNGWLRFDRAVPFSFVRRRGQRIEFLFDRKLVKKLPKRRLSIDRRALAK